MSGLRSSSPITDSPWVAGSAGGGSGRVQAEWPRPSQVQLVMAARPAPPCPLPLQASLTLAGQPDHGLLGRLCSAQVRVQRHNVRDRHAAELVSNLQEGVPAGLSEGGAAGEKLRGWQPGGRLCNPSARATPRRGRHVASKAKHAVQGVSRPAAPAGSRRSMLPCAPCPATPWCRCGSCRGWPLHSTAPRGAGWLRQGGADVQWGAAERRSVWRGGWAVGSRHCPHAAAAASNRATAPGARGWHRPAGGRQPAPVFKGAGPTDALRGGPAACPGRLIPHLPPPVPWSPEWRPGAATPPPRACPR